MSEQKRGGRINRINPLIHQIVSRALLRNSDPLLNKATVTHSHRSVARNSIEFEDIMWIEDLQ